MTAFNMRWDLMGRPFADPSKPWKTNTDYILNGCIGGDRSNDKIPIGNESQRSITWNNSTAEGGQCTMTKSMFNKEKWLPMTYLPFKISHYCCRVMKKQPLHNYQRENSVVPILGTMASESRIRRQGWIRTGCNAFKGKDSKSQPMSFWTDQDVLEYIIKFAVPTASVYGDIVQNDKGKLVTTGVDRTGCIFCAYGFHSDKEPTRFQRLKETHPKQYDYALRGGEWVDNPDYDPTAPEYDGIWKNWNPEKIWVPSKEGLGFRKVFEMCNEVYGEDFYKYE